MTMNDEKGLGPQEDTEEPGEATSEFDEAPEEESTRLETVAWEATNTAKEILTHFPRIEEPEVESRIEDGGVWVDIGGDPSGRLIGRKGQTIDAFQHVLSKIMSHRLRKKMTIHVDAEGYKKRNREKLIGLAIETADYVAATGGARALEPMSPADRRIVHLTLKEREDVITASEGEDRDRFVVIWPADVDEE